MSKKNIAIFTSTRSDISILSPLIEKISSSKKLNYLLFVHGTHLEKKYGLTVTEILKSKFKITKKFKTHFANDQEYGQIENLTKTQIEANKVFKNYDFDTVIILGDRIERLPIMTCCIVYRKITIHLHGGEETYGAIDDLVRHTLTKSSHLHFVICDKYKKKLMKIGENPKHIYNYGSLAVEKLNNYINKKEIKQNLVILTFHPETIHDNFDWKSKFKNIIAALNKFKFNVIVTAPGFEKNSIHNIKQIKKILKNKKKFEFIESLGSEKYFKLLNKSIFVIGNSSSGIIEVPYYKIPTVNIGIRQKGRFMHKSIIQCGYSIKDITRSIKKAQSKFFLSSIKNMKLEFGNGQTSKKIINVIEKKIFHKKKLMQKKIYEN